MSTQDVQTQAIAQRLGKIFRQKVKGIRGFGEFPKCVFKGLPLFFFRSF